MGPHSPRSHIQMVHSQLGSGEEEQKKHSFLVFIHVEVGGVLVIAPLPWMHSRNKLTQNKYHAY